MTYHTTIPGDPVPKGRPRMTKTGHTYTPPRTKKWEKHAAALIRHVLAGDERLEGPVFVTVMVVLKRPKRLCRKKDPPGRVPAPVRPDLDNFVKAALDAMTTAGVWYDDGQVTGLLCSKWHAEKDGEPRVELTWGPAEL